MVGNYIKAGLEKEKLLQPGTFASWYTDAILEWGKTVEGSLEPVPGYHLTPEMIAFLDRAEELAKEALQTKLRGKATGAIARYSCAVITKEVKNGGGRLVSGKAFRLQVVIDINYELYGDYGMITRSGPMTAVICTAGPTELPLSAADNREWVFPDGSRTSFQGSGDTMSIATAQSIFSDWIANANGSITLNEAAKQFAEKWKQYSTTSYGSSA